jgi:uncharacterized protein (TIGR01777 family)
MMNRVLITGGTGFVGTYLCKYLIANRYKISILSRDIKENTEDISYFLWDINDKKIDKTCLYKVQTIIHLAGENVAGGRWSEERKKRILESRTKSTELLYDLLKRESNNVKTFIAASATGIYGSSTTENVYTEKDEFGSDFLADVCVQWETSVFKINSLGIRTVALRTGIVLAKDKGALAKMTAPFKLGLGSAIASGKQYMPWIHIEDLCKMYLFALENNKIIDSYNAVVGDTLNNDELSKGLSKVLKRPFFMPRVPKLLLNLIFGEMAIILTEGSRVSSTKIKNDGFQFKYPTLTEALKNLFS